MDEQHPTSLSSQILLLQTRHRALERELEAMAEFPYIDQIKLQRLKKQKLRLKDQIARLRARLIPDLDA